MRPIVTIVLTLGLVSCEGREVTTSVTATVCLESDAPVCTRIMADTLQDLMLIYDLVRVSQRVADELGLGGDFAAQVVGGDVEVTNFCGLDTTLKPARFYYSPYLGAPVECWTKSFALRWFLALYGRLPERRADNGGERDPVFQSLWDTLHADITARLRGS